MRCSKCGGEKLVRTNGMLESFSNLANPIGFYKRLFWQTKALLTKREIACQYQRQSCSAFQFECERCGAWTLSPARVGHHTECACPICAGPLLIQTVR